MTIQIVIILFSLLLSPSEPDLAIFLGFNNLKVFLFAIFFFVLLFLLPTLIILKNNNTLVEKVFSRIKLFCETGIGSYLVFMSMMGSNLILLTGLFSILTGIISRDQYSELYRLFINSLPIIIFWWFLSIEVFILLTLLWDWNLNFFDISEQITLLIKSKGFAIFWIVGITITSLLHWVILICDWPVFDLIPLWYWQTISKINLLTWLIFPLGLLLIAGYYFLQTNILSKSTKTLLVVLIGYILMVGFAAMEGDPYQVLFDKRYISGHRNYIALAARKEGGQEFLFDYDSALGHDRFYATKPPGVYMLYRGLLSLGSLVFPSETYEQKYDAINHTSMLLLPILALGTTFFVEKLTERLTSIKPANLPGFILLVTPNFLLLSVTIDQSIIPFLYTSGLLLGILAIKKDHFWFSVAFGIYLYIGLYFSFSLLPLILLFGLWIVFEWARDWNRYNYSTLAKFAISSLLGFMILFILFLVLFNYSPIDRYQAAITIHEIQRPQPTTITAYLNMYLLNNVEMATWVGLPLAFSAIIAIFSSSLNIFGGKWTSIDSMAIAFAGTYFFVNHFSNTLSEVGRLWIFFVPIICIFTADFIQQRLQKKPFVIIYLILQLMTVFFIVRHLRITWE
jgi:hypothetical protein